MSPGDFERTFQLGRGELRIERHGGDWGIIWTDDEYAHLVDCWTDDQLRAKGHDPEALALPFLEMPSRASK